jgi:hypothetical protein
VIQTMLVDALAALVWAAVEGGPGHDGCEQPLKHALEDSVKVGSLAHGFCL